MLVYGGSRQAPRKYPIPESAETQLHRTSPCLRCRSQVWCPSLYSNLRTLERATAQFVVTYQVSASELRQSVITGCKWCQTLADGIHGRIFLDRMYERFNHTDSDPSTPQGESDMIGESGGEVSSNGSELGDDVELDAADDLDLDLDDAVDNLAVDSAFSITLCFERDANKLFSVVNVHIESASPDGNQHDNPALKLRGENSVDLCYEIRADTQYSSELQSGRTSLFPSESGATTLGSEVSLDRLSSWTQSNRSRRNSSGGGSLHVPSRVIDISTSNLRVVNTCDIELGGHGALSYVALSYVWGARQTFVLLHRTEPKLTQSFSIDELPRTIQDAVKVARRVGFRYIWVDALCIVQDSIDDKNRELPKMGRIYQGAALTLVAAVAKSAVEGFLHVQEQKLYHIEPIDVPCYQSMISSNEETVKLSYAADYKRWKDPINDRAWTFQEFLLSPFVASFSYRGIETIDHSTQLSGDRHISARESQLQGLDWRQSILNLAPQRENIRQIWLAVRGEYSQRCLGYISDKLVAISAVAEQIGSTYKTTYLAGLWERDLANDLKWCHADVVYSENSSRNPRPRRMPRPEQYVAPSWSWASIDGPIDDYTYEGGVEVKDWLGFHVSSCEVAPAIPNFEYGAVTAGKLTVYARMHAFFWRPEENPTVDCDGFLAVKTNEEPWPEWKVGEVILDCLDPELSDGCVVECLAVSLVERIPGRDEIECLVLLPAGEDIYRRVGFGKVSVTALYDDAELFKIQIV